VVRNRGHGLSPAAPRVRLPPGTHFGVHVGRVRDLEVRMLVRGRFQHPRRVPVAVNRPHIAAVAATMGEVRVPEEQRTFGHVGPRPGPFSGRFYSHKCRTLMPSSWESLLPRADAPNRAKIGPKWRIGCCQYGCLFTSNNTPHAPLCEAIQDGALDRFLLTNQAARFEKPRRTHVN
jgi:hypothetical protein